MPTAIEEYKEIIVACLGHHPQMMILLRRASSLARRKGLGWIALHVEETRRKTNTKAWQEERVRILQNLHLAEEMGAEIKIIKAPSFSEGLKIFLDELAAKTRISFFIGAVDSPDEEIPFIGDGTPRRIEKLLPPGSNLELVNFRAPVRNRSLYKEILENHFNIRDVAYAILAVAVATLVLFCLQAVLPEGFNNLRNRTMVYIIACVFVSIRFGLLPGLITSIASFFAMNYMFETVVIPSSIVKNLQIDSPPMMVSLGLYILCSVAVSAIAGKSHDILQMMRRQVSQLQIPQRIYASSLKANTVMAALEAVHKEIKVSLDLETVFFLPSVQYADRVEAMYPSGIELAREDIDALTCSWREFRVTGAGTHHFAKASYCFRPLLTNEVASGVMAVKADRHFFENQDISGTLATIADVAALVIERLRLTQQTQEANIREEKESLRALLLSSVSHDLKTPLASVIGSLSAIRGMKGFLPQEQKDILLQTALDEARRLDGFITNILEMTRLESGQINFKQQWTSPYDLLGSVTRRFQDKFSERPLLIDKASVAALEVMSDPMLLEQVFQNILDNAVKYAPGGSAISIWAEADGDLMKLHIRDRGKGIPEDQLEKIFDKYTRLKKTDSNVAGTGLGLAIARTILRAQKADVVASNHPEGGAVFTFVFPQWRVLDLAVKVAE